MTFIHPRPWRAALLATLAGALFMLDSRDLLAQTATPEPRRQPEACPGSSSMPGPARRCQALASSSSPNCRLSFLRVVESGPFMEASRTTRSDSAGQYRFASVANGRYHLRIERLGYRPTTVDVELRGNSNTRVAVELGQILVRLERMEVRGDAVAPYGRLHGESLGSQSSSLTATRQLRERNLATDAQAMTHQNVLESVTLAESDLLRALQRLPGVSARDDLTAAPWVRGARWDLTRLYFDGIPLHNPLARIRRVLGRE